MRAPYYSLVDSSRLGSKLHGQPGQLSRPQPDCCQLDLPHDFNQPSVQCRTITRYSCKSRAPVEQLAIVAMLVVDGEKHCAASRQELRKRQQPEHKVSSLYLQSQEMASLPQLKPTWARTRVRGIGATTAACSWARPTLLCLAEHDSDSRGGRADLVAHLGYLVVASGTRLFLDPTLQHLKQALGQAAAPPLRTRPPRVMGGL